MTCSGEVLTYHTLHNTPHSPLLPTTTPHTANHTPHTAHLRPLSSPNKPLNPSPSNSDRTPCTSDPAHQTQGGPGKPREARGGHRRRRGRAQSPVGPRLPPILSNNCCCQCFVLLLSWILFAAVIGVFSGYISFLAASIALDILQLTESAECNELKDEKNRMHNVHPSFFILQR